MNPTAPTTHYPCRKVWMDSATWRAKQRGERSKLWIRGRPPTVGEQISLEFDGFGFDVEVTSVTSRDSWLHVCDFEPL